MLVVLTNNGDWEADTLGVVGVITNIDQLGAFAEKHGNWSDAAGAYELYDAQPTKDFLQANEIDLIAEGEVVGSAISWTQCDFDEDGIYVAVAF